MAAPRDSKKGKKVDIRELMKQQKAARQSSSKRIESPLAKYNNLGQLICVVCNQQVKNEIIWTAHIQGKRHKDNVLLLKTNKAPVTPQIVPKSQPLGAKPVKRKAEPAPTSQPIKGILKKPSIGIAYDDSSSDESEDEIPQKSAKMAKMSKPSSTPQASNGSGSSVPSGLPADFFDSGISSSLSSSSAPDQSSASMQESRAAKSSESGTKQDEDQASKPMSEVLPEGFFDDPVKDAKIRKVEVRNTMEEEWGKFQKEMETQQQVSETLAEEDDEAAQTERNIDEIDEQIQCFAKVETLWNKKDELKTIAEDPQRGRDQGDVSMEEEGGSEEEADFEEFLNWRSKGAYK